MIHATRGHLFCLAFCAFLGTVVCAFPVSAQQPNFGEKVSSTTALKSNNPTTRLTASDDSREKLTQLCSLDFEENEFSVVMEFLEKNFGLQMHLDLTARDDALAEDEPITISLKNVQLKDALRVMLKEHNATYVVRHGIVHVISLDVCNDPEFFVRRMFDVTDLLQEIRELESHRIGKVEFSKPWHQQWSRRGLGGGLFCTQIKGKGVATAGDQVATSQSEANQSQSKGNEDAFYTAEDLLIAFVTTFVDRDGWDYTNGDGSARILGGILVVVQTEEANDQVEQLLEDFRSKLSKR